MESNYVTRNDSSIIAFQVPDNMEFYNFQIAAAHSDSPAFKIKENPEMVEDNNYVTLNVEKYGGMIMSSWFDRPLSIAGRVFYGRRRTDRIRIVAYKKESFSHSKPCNPYESRDQSGV